MSLELENEVRYEVKFPDLAEVAGEKVYQFNLMFAIIFFKNKFAQQKPSDQKTGDIQRVSDK